MSKREALLTEIEDMKQQNAQLEKTIRKEKFLLTRRYYNSLSKSSSAGEPWYQNTDDEKYVLFKEHSKLIKQISTLNLQPEELVKLKVMSKHYQHLFNTYVPFTITAICEMAIPLKNRTLISLSDPYGTIECETKNAEILQMVGTPLNVDLYAVNDNGNIRYIVKDYRTLDYMIKKHLQ